ncbi:MAG: alpha/beta hydrolase fold domain-containing protein [Rhodocyclaceae bacterium]
MPTNVPAGYTYYHDVFVGTGGNSNIYMEIVAPTTDPGKRLPVIARIHGGGWNHGDKNDQASAIVSDATKGYVGVSMMYRLTPTGAVFPAQLHDLKLGLRYLRANAAKYFIDPDKIGVWGSSSGGHLASLLGTTGGVAALEGTGGWSGYSTRVQAVVDASGPADFTTSFANAWSSVTALLGAPAKSVPELAHAAMPGDYATTDDPPFLILHGDADTTVPPADSVYFKDQLIAAGVDTTFSLVAGAGHSLSAYGWVSPLQRAFMDFNLRGVGTKPVPPEYVPLPTEPTTPTEPDSLVPAAKWSLNEDATMNVLADSSQADPGVALKRNSTSGQASAAGKYGNAIHFLDGYSYLSNNVLNTEAEVMALNFKTTSKMSAEAWVNLDTLPSTYVGTTGSAKLIYKINSTSKAGYELYIGPDNKPTFKIWLDGSVKYAVTAPTALTTGQWIHLAGTYDGTALRIYVNGALANTTFWSGTFNDAGANDIKIGATTTNKSSTSTGLMGWMDEIRLYDRALTDAEVLGRYQAQ